MDSNILYLNIQNINLGLRWLPNGHRKFNMYLNRKIIIKVLY
jgi:hypothetical protein